MIDFHCHLDLYTNVLSFIKEVEKRNKFTLVVTTSPRAWIATSKVFASINNIEFAIGMHPEILINKYVEKNILIENISRSRFVGEIGIDGSVSNIDSLPIQISLFKDIVRESESCGGRILSIHSRKAELHVLDILEQECFTSTPILHWFTGNKSLLSRAINMQCFFSVGPSMTRTIKGKRIISEIPIEYILPESDGPFASIRNNPVMPWEAINIVPDLSEVYGIPKEQILKQLVKNAQQFTTTLS